MKNLFFGSCLLVVVASNWTSPGVHGVDGAPTDFAAPGFTEGYEEISAKRLFEAGVQAYSLDALDGEYAFYFSFDEELSGAINDGKVAVHFSLVTSSGDLVLGMPTLHEEDMTFWMVDDYRIQVMLEIKSDYRGLKEGYGHFTVLNPRDYLKEE